MLTTVLFLALAAGPRAHAEAEWAVYVPKAQGLFTLVPFFNRAGERSVLFRPGAWREDLHPLLTIDLTRPDDLEGSGIDLEGSITVSAREEFVFTCVQLREPAKYEQKCKQRLATLGTPFRETGKDGVVRAGARDPVGRVLAAYVLKGRESCAIKSKGRSVDQKLDEAAKLLGKAATGLPFKLADGLNGAAVLVSKQGALALRGTEQSLTLEGRGKGMPTAGLLGAGPSPFGAANPDGMLVAKLRGDRKKLDGAADQVVRTVMQVCFACEKPLLDEVVRGLLPQLGGNALAFAREVQLRGSLKTMSGRYFSVRNVLLADVLDEKAAREALAPLGRVLGVKPTGNGEGYSVGMRDGEIRFGVRGRVLYIANDERALEVALKAAAKGEGTQAHGMELKIDPRRLARGLAQVPLIDAIRSQDLTGLVLVAGELGPLLLSSAGIAGWADPTGPDTSRGRMDWALLPAAPRDLDGGLALDGGVAGDGGLALDGGVASDGGVSLDGGAAGGAAAPEL